MDIAIEATPLEITVYGYSGTAMHQDYSGMAFQLMGKMWKTVQLYKLKNKGMNTWVYEPDHAVFAGVELLEIPVAETGMELKQIRLTKYARYKHIGPYSLIKQTGQQMTAELNRQGYRTVLPYIEIYGHWTKDESKLETDLLMSLE